MDTTKKVIKLLRKLSGKKSIKLSDNLKKDIALDSLGLVMLLVEIETTFYIELDEADMNPLDLLTVSDVVELVEKYKEA